MILHQTETSEGSSASTVTLTNRTVSNSVSAGTCHSGIILGLDGVLSTLNSAGGASVVIGQWLVVGTPSNYYVQRTITNSGSLEVDPGSGFLQINVNRTFDNIQFSGGIKTTIVYLEIADSAEGTNIVATATMTFLSESGLPL